MPQLTKAFVFILFAVIFGAEARALSSQYTIEVKESSLVCSIRYSVVGVYRAGFDAFSGQIDYHPDRLGRSAVKMKIQSGSVQSRWPVLDRIVRSERLLNTQRYPVVNFVSTRIFKHGGEYFVDGILTLHDIRKRYVFPFKLEGPFTSGGKKYVKASGSWDFNRKDFEIIWHDWLDQGGVVVGNTVTFDWEILAREKAGRDGQFQ